MYQLCAENITKGGLVPSVAEAERHLLMTEVVLPPGSSARGRVWVVCPVRVGSPKLVPCCLCNNWCHVPCSIRLIWVGSVLVTSGFWTLGGRSWLCHTHLWKTTVCFQPGQPLEQKHAWLSAGLIWMLSVSDSGKKGEYSDPKPEEPEFRPTINLFELWEDGSQQATAVSVRDYQFPMCFVASCPWLACPKALSLRDAVEGVAHNSRNVARMDGVAHNSLSPGTHVPNQPSLSKGSTESNSLTFW